MTGYGFCGPMTAQGTVFDAKEEGAADLWSPVHQHWYVNAPRHGWLVLLGLWLLGW